MSKNIRNNVFAAFCAIALLFAVAAGVEAQSEDPIFDDDIMCSVTQGDVVWVVPVALQPQLEAHLNAPGVVETMHALLQRLPPASSTNGVRIEGGHPSPGVAQDLDALGYQTVTVLDPTQVPGTLTGVLYTL